MQLLFLFALFSKAVSNLPFNSSIKFSLKITFLILCSFIYFKFCSDYFIESCFCLFSIPYFIFKTFKHTSVLYLMILVSVNSVFNFAVYLCWFLFIMAYFILCNLGLWIDFQQNFFYKNPKQPRLYFVQKAPTLVSSSTRVITVEN